MLTPELPVTHPQSHRFAAAGEAAVDLLARLLAFDPARRCSPEEALAHEYFSDISVSEGGEWLLFCAHDALMQQGARLCACRAGGGCESCTAASRHLAAAAAPGQSSHPASFERALPAFLTSCRQLR